MNYSVGVWNRDSLVQDILYSCSCKSTGTSQDRYSDVHIENINLVMYVSLVSDM